MNAERKPPTGLQISAVPIPAVCAEMFAGDGQSVPFDVSRDEIALGPRRLWLWRPSCPRQVVDPGAERGAAGPVWAHAWKSGLALADVVAQWPFAQVRVLELGCGLGLVGLAAAAAGAQVTVSDKSAYALALAALNAEANGLTVDCVRCDWGDAAPLERLGRWDVVLAADVLYAERSAYQLLTLLDRVVASTGEILIADPGRQPASAFLAAASSGWCVSSHTAKYGVRLHRLRQPQGDYRES